MAFRPRKHPEGSVKTLHRGFSLFRDKRMLLALPAFGLLMVAAIWWATILQLAASERAVLASALHETETFVTAYERFLRRTVKNADRTALLVKREFEGNGTVNLPELVQAGLVDAGRFVRVNVFDSDGNTAGSSMPRETAINVADREYFRLHEATDTGKLDIGKPVVRRSSGETVILLTRRLNHRDGSFAGVVAIAVTPDFFTEFYQESDLGKRGSLGVLGLDGAYRARRVGLAPASVPELGNPALLDKARLNPVGSYEGVSATDHLTRLFAYRQLEDYPLVIAAGQEKNESLVAFRRSQSNYLIIAALATGAILLFFAVVTTLAMRLQRHGEKLAEQRRFLRTLIDNMPDGVAVRSVHAGSAGAYLLWNKANEALFGVKTEQALGKTVVDVMPPETAARIMNLDRELLLSPTLQEDVETRDVTGRGRRVIRRVRTPIFGVDGEVEYLLSMSSDVTDAHARAEELRLAAKVFESTADGVILTDGDDRVISVNKAFSKLTGYAPDDMLGKALSETPFRPTDREEADARMQHLHRYGAVTGEVPRQHKNGKPLALWVTAIFVRDGAGKIVNYVRVFTDISELRESQRKLEQLATFDALTGLPNRYLLQDRLVQALRRTSRYGGRMGLLFIDLDGFKDVNDTLGHDVGDLLLKGVATRLQECVRTCDTVCRFGGDEFVVLLEPLTDAADAIAVGDRIVSGLFPPFLIAGQRIKTTVSIGIALNPEDGTDATTLLKNADVAMYKAKKRGRNRLELFSAPAEDAVPLNQTQRPPSTSRHAPVTNAASSEAKKTAAVAISDGCDRRPSGIVATNFARNSGVSPPMNSASNPVSPATGLMTLTRML